MTEIGICLDCRHFKPDGYNTLPAHQRSGECDKLDFEVIELEVGCRAFCLGGTAKIESINAAFGCIMWEKV